ncbi:hypothetical protein [Vibrio gallaecicus]|uniref:hypothetical protein n=1 Tax=Vibrio gallaecicus TaxID=552386 RepID=UPI0025B5E266|nr:hypothetical protein [Vibrio gallaecicus]MDN3614167.1 hypothetical protein [Vibrio gallaecicus]
MYLSICICSSQCNEYHFIQIPFPKNYLIHFEKVQEQWQGMFQLISNKNMTPITALALVIEQQ